MATVMVVVVVVVVAGGGYGGHSGGELSSKFADDRTREVRK